MRNIVSFNSPDLSLMPFDWRAGNDWCVCGGGWGWGDGKRERDGGGGGGRGGGRGRVSAGVHPRDMIGKTGDWHKRAGTKLNVVTLVNTLNVVIVKLRLMILLT